MVLTTPLENLAKRRRSWGLTLGLTVLLIGSGCNVNGPMAAQDESITENGGDVQDGPNGVYTYGPASRDGRGKFYMGRELAQTMSYHGAPWLERGERQQEEMPDDVVSAMQLEPDDVVVDLGAGSGYFTFRMAVQVPQGKVLAVDIQPEMLEILEAKQRELGVTNVEGVLGTIEDPNLPPGVDAVLMVDAYHEFSHPREIMTAVVSALAPDGQVVLVEYRGEDPSVPIKELHKMTQEQVRQEMAAVGLDWIQTLDFLPSQHVMVFQK